MKSVLLSLRIINLFRITGLIQRTFVFKEKETKYVSIFLNDDLKPKLKFGTHSGYGVLSNILLVTYK